MSRTTYNSGGQITMKEIPVQITMEYPTEHENKLKGIMESHGYKFLSRFTKDVNNGCYGNRCKLFMQFKYVKDILNE